MKIKPLFYLLIRLILLSLLMVALVEVFKYDSVQGERGNRFYENSLTEILQVFFLFFGSALSFYSAVRKKLFRAFFVSMGTFLLICFFREFNNFFNNNVFDSAWQILVYSTLLPYVIYAFKHWKQIIKDLTTIATEYGFGIFIAGFIIVFVFSRLYGLHGIWQNLLGEDYIRDIKNISEEAIELLGYSLMLAGVVELVIFTFVNKAISSK